MLGGHRGLGGLGLIIVTINRCQIASGHKLAGLIPYGLSGNSRPKRVQFRSQWEKINRSSSWRSRALLVITSTGADSCLGGQFERDTV